MLELSNVEVYVACLEPRVVGRDLERIRLLRPFVLRSVTPTINTAHGKTVR